MNICNDDVGHGSMNNEKVGKMLPYFNRPFNFPVIYNSRFLQVHPILSQILRVYLSITTHVVGGL